MAATGLHRAVHKVDPEKACRKLPRLPERLAECAERVSIREIGLRERFAMQRAREMRAEVRSLVGGAMRAQAVCVGRLADHNGRNQRGWRGHECCPPWPRAQVAVVMPSALLRDRVGGWAAKAIPRTCFWEILQEGPGLLRVNDIARIHGRIRVRRSRRCARFIARRRGHRRRRRFHRGRGRRRRLHRGSRRRWRGRGRPWIHRGSSAHRKSAGSRHRSLRGLMPHTPPGQVTVVSKAALQAPDKGRAAIRQRRGGFRLTRRHGHLLRRHGARRASRRRHRRRPPRLRLRLLDRRRRRCRWWRPPPKKNAGRPLSGGGGALGPTNGEAVCDGGAANDGPPCAGGRGCSPAGGCDCGGGGGGEDCGCCGCGSGGGDGFAEALGAGARGTGAGAWRGVGVNPTPQRTQPAAGPGSSMRRARQCHGSSAAKATSKPRALSGSSFSRSRQAAIWRRFA